MKSIGIVGCGAIGRALLKAVEGGVIWSRVAGVTSRTGEKAIEFLSTLREPPPFLTQAELIARSDLVIEAAGQNVFPGLAFETFDQGKELMVISIGALLDYPEIMSRSRETGCGLFLPSGAIAGLDGIKSASAGEVSRVTMISRKPPEGLEGAPYLVEQGISLAGLSEEKEVFSGSAREACRGFPANVNVSAAVSLAGIGPDRTQVRILAVPGLKRNCHDVEIEGEFGRLAIHIENVPTENPRTGRLTILSMIRAVQDAMDPVRIGT